MEKIFIPNSQSAWTTVGEGMRRQIAGYNDQLMMVKVEFQQGSVGAVHKHPHSQASYVASGKFEVQVGDEKMTLAAGDCFFAAPNVPHGTLCLEAGVLVDVFSPMRNDFVA
ncbi:MAG: cupin domain-containing protein [Prevotellaceae bacterium]|jgi:quercetin dioxygenase-like cupin family protein|nr:cupin domain-containing protein [Prevotellaceae bacterium]